MRTNSRLRLSSLLSKYRSDSGFTLTDLLISAGLTTTVVAGAGIGVAAMIDSSTVANARSERSVELNRSLDFISSEIRQADSIVANAQSAANPAAFSPAGVPGTATKVLMVNLPNAAAPVVYYVATPPAGSWAGPEVVYRWGPRFNANGDYDALGNPASWESLPVIEKIQASDASGSTSAKSCGSGWTASGTFGFSTCVNSSGTVAEIYQNGKINKVLGRSENLAADVKVGTRNTDVQFSPPPIPNGAIAASLPALPSPSASPSTSPSSTPVSSPTPSPSATPVPPITLVTGEVRVPATSTMHVRVLGGAITCGPSGPSIPTSAQLRFTGGTSLNQTISTAPNTSVTRTVAPNTSLTITGTSGPYCVSISANSLTSNGRQVVTLRNGETVPNFRPFDNQKSIQTILTSASTNPLTNRPILNPTTGRVTLAPNQAIYLYELGTTSRTSSAFDMQDLVILATVTPS